ncbi:MAG: site-specific integrase [Bacteroidetes bacterium]|nr:site-specific integrase [Bacteroidota bacterium]
MSWQSYIKGFSSYLKLEKSLSSNSNEAYVHDIEKLFTFLNNNALNVSPEKISLEHLQDFIKWINEEGMSARSQARIISGIKAFYKYLLLENLVTDDPTELLQAPKIGRKLPDFFSSA